VLPKQLEDVVEVIGDYRLLAREDCWFGILMCDTSHSSFWPRTPSILVRKPPQSGLRKQEMAQKALAENKKSAPVIRVGAPNGIIERFSDLARRAYSIFEEQSRPLPRRPKDRHYNKRSIGRRGCTSKSSRRIGSRPVGIWHRVDAAPARRAS
jgi:hypothetical protein